MSAALDMTPEVTSFGEHCQWTGIRSDGDRKAWLNARRTMLTASDFAAILGENEDSSPLAVYAEKVCPPIDEKLSINDPRFWGLKLEQPILGIVAEYYGWKYRSSGVLLRSRKHPMIGATLDGEVDCGEGWLVYEGKTTRVPKNWHQENDEIPTRVLIQAQAQLLVTGAPANVVFGLLQGSRPCLVRVEPNRDFHALLVEEGERFMQRVRDLDPPPPMQGRDESSALKRLYPRDDGQVIKLPAETGDWTRRYQAVSKEIAVLKAEQEHLQDKLRALMGPATFGLLPYAVGGKTVWRNQFERRAGYSVEPTEFRKLLALKEIK
jgi:putative phage-type endonuclease